MLSNLGLKILRAVDGNFSVVPLNANSFNIPCKEIEKQVVFYLYKSTVIPANPTG
jgi:hypothetical protein